jgi:hypothetical protein
MDGLQVNESKAWEALDWLRRILAYEVRLGVWRAEAGFTSPPERPVLEARSLTVQRDETLVGAPD